MPFVAVLLYPGSIFFEVALAAETVAPFIDVRWYTPEGLPHAASNGAQIAPHGSYGDLMHIPARAVLVPGGDPGSILLPENVVAQCLRFQRSHDAVIASICAGNLVLAACGLLEGRRGTHNYTEEHASPEALAATAHHWRGLRFERADVVRDGNLITAQPWAYREYASTVARVLGLLDEPEVQVETAAK